MPNRNKREKKLLLLISLILIENKPLRMLTLYILFSFLHDSVL